MHSSSPTAIKHILYRLRWPINHQSFRRSIRPMGSRRRVHNSSSGSGTGFFSWYTKQLDERPMITKIISSALIATAGDIICQVLENKFAIDSSEKNEVDMKAQNVHETTVLPNTSSTTTVHSEGERTQERQNTKSSVSAGPMLASIDTNIDWYRAGRFCLIGAFWVAPATHLWYGFLSTRLIPGAATPKRVIQRLFLDQFGAAPVFCPAFMGLLWLLEGKPLPEVKTDLLEAGPTLVTSNWKLWIPAMGLMFSVIPLKFQVVYSNFVGLVWTVYLSYASTRLSSQPSEDD